MHFPIEFLLLGLVGKGTKWIGGKGWLPPKESGMPFKSRGKVGYLGADGKPAIDENDKPLTAKQKAAIMKKEEQMKAAEMGIEVKPEKKAKAKTGGTSYASQKKKLDKGGTVDIGSESKYSEATEMTTKTDYRLRRASSGELRTLGSKGEGNYVVDRRVQRGDQDFGWQVMRIGETPESAIAKSAYDDDFRVAVRRGLEGTEMIKKAQAVIDAEDSQ